MLEDLGAHLATDREAHARQYVDQMMVEVPEYFAGGDQAIITLAIESTSDWLYGIASGLQHGRRLPEAPPSAALKEALLTAQMGIPWRAVEKTIWVGYREIVDRLLAHILGLGLPPDEEFAVVRATHRFVTTYCSELSASLAHVYETERDRVVRRGEHRRIEVVRALLQGREVSSESLGYSLDGEQWAIIVVGPDREDIVNDLARHLGCAALTTPGIDGTMWAWLGGRPTIDRGALGDWEPQGGNQVVFGMIDRDQEGFVRSHDEALEALRVARLSGAPVTHYDSVAIEAFALHDERLAHAFVVDELATLADDDDRARQLRETLRAYFGAGNNGSATAARLGVHERTVSYRLGTIEATLPYGITGRRDELVLALRLHELLVKTG